MNCTAVSLLDLEVAELPSIVFLLLRAARRYPDDVDIVQSVGRAVAALARSAPISAELGAQRGILLMTELIGRDVPAPLPRETQQTCLFAVSEMCRLGSNATMLRRLGEAPRGAAASGGVNGGPESRSGTRRADAASRAAGLMMGGAARGPLSLPVGEAQARSLAEARAILAVGSPTGGLSFLREVSTRGEGESRDRDRVVRRLPGHVKEGVRQRLLQLSAMRSWVLVSLGQQNRHRIEGVGGGDEQVVLLEPARSAGLASAAEEAESSTLTSAGPPSGTPAAVPPGNSRGGSRFGIGTPDAPRPGTSTRLRGYEPGLGDDPMHGIATGSDALRAVGGPGELPPGDPISLLSTGGLDGRIALAPGPFRSSMASHGHDVNADISAGLVRATVRQLQAQGAVGAQGWRHHAAAAAAALASMGEEVATGSGSADAPPSSSSSTEDALTPILLAINTTVRAPRSVWQRMGLAGNTKKPVHLRCNAMLMGGETWVGQLLRGFSDGAWPEYRTRALTKEGLSVGDVMAGASNGGAHVPRQAALVGDGHVVPGGVPRGYLPLDLRNLGPPESSAATNSTGSGTGGSGGAGASYGGAAAQASAAPGASSGGALNGSAIATAESSIASRATSTKKKKKKKMSSKGPKRNSRENPILRAIAEEKRGKGVDDGDGFQKQLAPGAADEAGDAAAGVDGGGAEGRSAGGSGARNASLVPRSASEWLTARGAYEDALERRVLAMY